MLTVSELAAILRYLRRVVVGRMEEDRLLRAVEAVERELERLRRES